ncbi:DUF4861 domain-containing protein [Reichenbachiella ulvae]|uniref:DUF4861 domain-containing protein n=1 Tax=Reichenbachiella ulvae TaxID=2980104 RepID=A0ABT3CNT3_9BACT|nr:DUF4861 domain-containing protein [Reichenbachiella ulvae]MCV9385400.1 DUF4861 domain-containing protein [Reichenbachiella ulvae]
MDRKTLYLVLGCMGGMLAFSCGDQQKKTENSEAITLNNPSSFDRKEVVAIASADGVELPKPGFYSDTDWKVEAQDQNADGQTDQLLVYGQWAANESKSLDLSALKVDGITKAMTQAEISVQQGGEWQDRKYVNGQGFKNVDFLRVPQEHTDHSYYIRYEGPGLESDKVGYRYYLDWRNAVDIFGKKVNSMVLQQVGQDGFDSYHEPSDWGMDVLKAGKSLGVGSIGRLIGDSVVHFQLTDSVTCQVQSGYLQSKVTTNYYGWDVDGKKIDLQSEMSINAGEHAVKHTVDLSEATEGFVTGLVKNSKGERLEALVGSGGWTYIATYGPQSLAEDNLGMALIYHTKDVEAVREGGFDHLIQFKTSEKPFSYYLLGAWEQEPNGIKDKASFKAYLDQKVAQLNEPIQISN